MRSALSPVRLLRALLPLLVLLALTCVGCAAETFEDSASSRSASSEGPVAKQAAEKLKAAVEKKDATDVRLGRALARVSPMITIEENRRFVSAFQALPDVRVVSADYHARASALDAELRRILSRDSELSAVMDGLTLEGTDYIVYGPDQLFEGYALLAQSPSASGALAFAARLLAGDPKLAAVRASDREIVERILIPALPGTYLQNLLTSGSNERATSLTKEILSTGGSKLRSTARWLDTHNKLTGNDITADTIQVSGRSVGEALRGVAAVMAIWELGGDLSRGDVEAVIQGFVKGGPGAVSGLAQATSLFRRVLLGIDETPLADLVVKYSGNLAKGISFVSTIFSLIENAGQWNEGAAAKVRVAGDLVALGASVLVLVGASGPAGLVLGTVAVGIHLLADWLESRAIAAQERSDLAACLPATGVGSVLVDRMLGSHPALVRILSETVKLSPTDLQWFMTVYPEAVASDSYTPLQYIGVQVAQKLFDLDGAETRGMLTAVIGSESDAQKKTQMLDMFLRGLEYGQGWNGDITRAQALSWLDREATSDTSGRAAERALRQAAFRNGRAYLAAR
ncbi:MAG: hypothetical protein KF850_27445 [Labilithrix sp.]|nr:hypothetical protein [Labilithrix sp.]